MFLISCTTPNYLPKQYKIGEVEHFDFEESERIKIKNLQMNIFFKVKD